MQDEITRPIRSAPLGLVLLLCGVLLPRCALALPLRLMLPSISEAEDRDGGSGAWRRYPALRAPLLRQTDELGWLDPRRPHLRGGVGLDLDLPDHGKLHVDLLPSRDPLHTGLHWDVLADAPTTPGKLWSLGLCLDVGRSRPQLQNPYGARQVLLAPQLQFDLDRLTGLGGQAQLVLQRSHWSDRFGRDSGLGEAWQLMLRWRY